MGVMCSTFMYSQQDPSSGVFNVLWFLDALAGNPAEKCVTVIESGAGEGVDELLCIS